VRRLPFVDEEARGFEGLDDSMLPYMVDWGLLAAEGVQQAPRLLKKDAFDVMVRDMRTPGMGGAALPEEVQGRPLGMVRMLLPGLAGAETTRRAMPVAGQFLSKPCDANRPTEVLERTCRHHETIDDQKLNSVRGDVQCLPSGFPVHDGIRGLTTGEGWMLTKVDELIESNVVIEVNVLQMTDACRFTQGTMILSMSQAVATFDFQLVSDLVLAFETFKHLITSATFDVEAVQCDGLIVGALAGHAALEAAAGDALVAGFSYDIGQLLLTSRLSDRIAAFEARPMAAADGYIDIEERKLGSGHPESGAYLLARSAMPYSVVVAVCHHHRTAAIPQSELGAIAEVYMAQILSKVALHGRSPRSLMLYLGGLGVADRLDRWSAWTDKVVETNNVRS